jgi:hypothetical protein
MYRDLIALRRNLSGKTRGLTGQNLNVFHADNGNKTLAYHRWENGGSGDDVVVVWTRELEIRIDEISRALPGFFVGRYNIRFDSEEELRRGTSFKIVEVNGAASEATSIYDPRNSLWNAYRTLFKQWRLVFALGAANRQRGFKPAEFSILRNEWRRYCVESIMHPLAD